MTRTARRAALLASLALALLTAGCGGDDEPEPAATTQAQTATTTPREATTEETTETEQATRTEDTAEAEAQPRERSRERERKQERNEGDEEEARTEVVLTGRGGKVTPTRVSVPPFLAIRVILRARDNDAYFVTLGGSGTGSGGKQRSELDLDGLRPGKRYEGRYFVNGRPSGPVLIVADAEGGP